MTSFRAESTTCRAKGSAQGVVIAVGLLVSLGCGASWAGTLSLDRVKPDVEMVTVVRYEVRRGRLRPDGKTVLRFDVRGYPQRRTVYDARGRIVEVSTESRNARGDVVRTTYRDRRGRLTTSTLSYTYLPDKRIARVVTRRKGDAEQLLAVYRYEKNGSYSIRTYLQRPGSPPHEGPWQRFDKTGKLLSRCSTGGVCSLYEYDARGTVRRVRLQMRGRHHYRRYLNEYDANGRLVRQKVGGEERRYRYNPRGELVEVTSRLAGELQSKSVRIYRYR